MCHFHLPNIRGRVESGVGIVLFFVFGFIFCHNTRREIRVALSRAQQQQCRATQDRCMLGIFVFLQPTEL